MIGIKSIIDKELKLINANQKNYMCMDNYLL